MAGFSDASSAKAARNLDDAAVGVEPPARLVRHLDEGLGRISGFKRDEGDAWHDLVGLVVHDYTCAPTHAP